MPTPQKGQPQQGGSNTPTRQPGQSVPSQQQGDSSAPAMQPGQSAPSRQHPGSTPRVIRDWAAF